MSVDGDRLRAHLGVTKDVSEIVEALHEDDVFTDTSLYRKVIRMGLRYLELFDRECDGQLWGHPALDEVESAESQYLFGFFLDWRKNLSATRDAIENYTQGSTL